ncbi:MAG: hypothetical protein ACLQBD_18390 [Syntrophobacteraceae bacterium]
MKENLMCPGHKTSTRAFREGWERTFEKNKFDPGRPWFHRKTGIDAVSIEQFEPVLDEFKAEIRSLVPEKLWHCIVLTVSQDPLTLTRTLVAEYRPKTLYIRAPREASSFCSTPLLRSREGLN